MDSINLEETLVLDSTIDSINQIEKLIDGQSQMLGIDDEVYGKYMLSVVECVNNAIVHGNKLSPEKKVTVHYLINNDKIEVTVQDQATALIPIICPIPPPRRILRKIAVVVFSLCVTSPIRSSSLTMVETAVSYSI